MKKYYDFSVHFTLKGQKLKDIEEKIDWFLKNNSHLLDCSEKEDNEPKTVLHHCFLPIEIIREQRLSEDVNDFLEELCEERVRWYFSDDIKNGVNRSRSLMIQNLKRLNGLSIFIGEIKDGVEEELSLVKLFGNEYLIIG